MKYNVKGLNWAKNMEQYDEDEQKILLALSHNDYKWRTKERLGSATGLEKTVLEQKLAKLIDNEVVRPSFSKTKNLIFGLTDRVGK